MRSVFLIITMFAIAGVGVGCDDEQPASMVAASTQSGSGATGDGDDISEPDSGMGNENVTPPAGDPLSVAIAQGTVKGFMSEGVRAFVGIPFGATTAGAGRFAPPTPAPAFAGEFDASEFKPACAQLNPTGTAFDATSEEDCLGINVWAPADTSVAKRPVMVWVYGGAYQFGNGADPYHGEALVSATDTIVVTFNYRLAGMGFLAHPAISAEARAAGAPPANFGLQDQQLAFKWVRDNIAAFGGDPDNVTVFGESAGANSICMHLVAPSSQGLFKRAIIESGLCTKPMLTLAEAEDKGARFAAAMGCDNPDEALACLRALEMQSVLTGPDTAPERTPGGLFYQDATQQFGFQPVVDGTLVPEQPAAAFAAGRFGQVEALITGATTDEGALFHVPPLGGLQPVDETEYLAALTVRFGDRASDVAAQYPLADYASPAEALSAVSADSIFRCPAIKLAEYARDAGKPTYLYRFDLTVDSPFEGLANRAFHSADIPYVFGNEYLLGSVPAERASVVETIQGYWGRFATTGDPNGAGAPTWPAFGMSAAHMNLAETIEAGSDWRAQGCAFWDDVAIVPF